MVEPNTLTTVVGAISAALGGTGTWGVIKLLALKEARNGNGHKPKEPCVAEERCKERMAVLTQGQDRIEEGVKEIRSILLRGTLLSG